MPLGQKSMFILRQGRGIEATEAVFCLYAKKPLHTGVRTGCHYFISLSVSGSVCATSAVFADCESCTRPIFFHKLGIYGNGKVWANAWDVFPRMPCRVGRGRRPAVDFVVCFGWGGFFFRFCFCNLFLPRTRTACCKHEATLPHLPLY